MARKKGQTYTRQTPSIDMKKEYGTERFYNVEVTPWLYITGDLQYVNPAEEQRDSDVVLGIRSNIRF